MLKRRDINALSQVELDNYIHALDIVRQRSRVNPDEPLGYDWHARRHNDMDVGPCEHGNDLFFAWHRCHLHYFEQVLRATDPDSDRVYASGRSRCQRHRGRREICIREGQEFRMRECGP